MSLFKKQAHRALQRSFRPAVSACEQRCLMSSVPAAYSSPIAEFRQMDQDLPSPTPNPHFSARNIEYTTRGGHPQALDIYLPPGEPPPGGWPVVMAIHGGGWRQFDRNQYAAKVAGPLVRSGFAVVAPDMTLSTPTQPGWPLEYQDVQDAVTWVHQNAANFDVNPDRIAAMGESAGGNLAAMLGTDPNAAIRVKAVVDFFGPTELTQLVDSGAAGAPAAVEFLGGAPTDLPQLYQASSPLDRVTSQSAPIFIAHGTADSVVPVQQSEELADAYAAHGVPYQLNLLPGQPHGFGLRVGNLDLFPSVVGFLRTYV